MKVYKYHVNGNSLLIANGTIISEVKYSDIAKKLCDCTISIGADGMVFFKYNPLRMYYYNQDGTYSRLCGNGLRVLSHHLHKFEKFTENTFNVISGGNKYRTKIYKFRPYLIEISFEDNSKIKENIVDIGNLHMIHTEEKDVSELSKNINHNFVTINNKNMIEIKTYEKGVGYTLSCSSGNIATFIYLLSKDLIEDFVVCRNAIDSMTIYKVDERVCSLAQSTFICEVDLEV